VLGPILYWDLVRQVRKESHFARRALLAGVMGAVVFGAQVRSDRSISSVAETSELVTKLSFTVQTFVIYLLVPAALAGAICDDRLQGRLLLLLATPLSRRRIVAEKLLVGVGLALLAMLTVLPFALLGPILGGVAPAAVIRAEAAAIVETVFVAAATLLISSRSVNGSEAMVKSFGFLFALRYALPYLDWFAYRLSPGQSYSAVFWSWATAVSPAAVDHAAWLADAATPGGPEFSTLLLIPLGLAAAAFELTVRSLDLRPERRIARRSFETANDSLLDADPLVWRSVQLRIYDRNGVWRRAILMLAAVFGVLVWIGASDVAVSFWTAFVVVAVVFIVNATLPIQWLINERKSGWFRELQLTPLTMDDVLRASIAGTRHHLRPFWWTAGFALALNLAFVASRDLFVGTVWLFALFMFCWPLWLAYWIAIEMGFTVESTAVGFVKLFIRLFLIACVLIPMVCSLFASALALFAAPRSSFSSANPMMALAVLAALVVAIAAYCWTCIVVRTYSLKFARTALFVTDKTRNFGHKGSDAAWQDWVGVTRDMGKERPVDVYHEAVPEVWRPRR